MARQFYHTENLIYPGNRYIIEKVKIRYKLHLNKCSTSQSSIFSKLSKQQILDENKLSDFEDLTSVTSFSLFVSLVSRGMIN